MDRVSRRLESWCGVLVVQMPAPLPRLRVDHWQVPAAPADLEFESERFNRAFRVQADDDRFGHAAMHPRMMELLLDGVQIAWRFEPVHYSVVALLMPGPLPYLEVGPEGVLDQALGSDDIEFENATFNAAFRVRADDPRYAYAVINPRMMAMLISRGDIPWRFEAHSVMTWQRGHHTAAQMLVRLHFLERVLDLIPPFVWKDYSDVDPR